ncbi:MAG: lipid A export permease/ATP-binding protein MsbA [Gammaproteobacteria bacterium RBG_16_57_12]|nr:MAG: lipid A export permease/ATP-binding protein MsbA [Gammaproteobacteria bacterium RBG_16_57_12]
MTQEPGTKALYLRLLGYVRPYRGVFSISILAMIVLAATEPAMPALFKPLLDGSFVEKNPDTIILMPLLLVLLFVVRGIASYISTVALAWVSNMVVMDLREQMFAKLLELPGQFYADHPSGTLISKFNYDAIQIRGAATNALVVLVRDTLAVFGLLAWMFYLDWQLTLLFFLIAPVIAFVIKLISLRMRNLSRALQNSMGDMTHTLEEGISGNKVVKVFGGQDYEKGRFSAVANWVRRFEMKIITLAAANVPTVQLIAAAALAIIIYIASLKPEMSVGTFVSFFGAMAMLFSPIKRLTGINEDLQRGLAATESLFGLIDSPSEPDTGTRTLEHPRGRIEFRHVSLTYPQTEIPALKNIDLVIQPGETVALVGRSGSGKTSLVGLVPRFYQPGGGQILIDDTDISEVRLDSLRAQIAIVTQETVLFNDSVAANIAYGIRNKVADEQIAQAARAAHAAEFIQQLPGGFNTLVGANGARLSGGQRQRLAIARALLKNAPILIFDEATSALDSESERHIQAALETLKAGRTTLIIAHRLSTIENADRIVVMDQGEIIESGTHRELLAKNGAYAVLHRLQFEHGEKR